MVRTPASSARRAIALTQAPFLVFEHDTAARLFRLFSMLGMIGALMLTAWALAPRPGCPLP